MYVKCQDKTVSRVLACLMLTFLTHTTGTPSLGGSPLDLPSDFFGIRKVVIDAGHGGKDPGCLGSHSREKDIALKIAKYLGEEINRVYPEIEVIYTRTEDVFIPLHERARIANRAQADLFISIHCNYVARRNQASGTETYIMGLHRAKENLDVAKRENAAILMEDDYAEHYDGYDPDSPEGHILMSMYQNAYLEQSIALAHAIETEFAGGAGRKSRGVKQAGFLVLRKTTMPSVLIETGFLSTDDEEAYLSSGDGQKETALSIFNAFVAYKNDYETGSSLAEVINTTDPVPANQGTPEFYVQLMATKEPVTGDMELLSRVSNLQTKRDHEFYKYLAGPYESLPLAIDARKELHDKGFAGAFVVAYQGDQRVQLKADHSVAND